MKKATLLVSAFVAIVALALPGAAFASKRDRDRDKMPDKWELKHHLNIHKNDAAKDPDRDHVSNLNEFRAKTDPQDADTDDDGASDGAEDTDGDGVDNANEDREGTNPNDSDTDNDGRKDGSEDADHDKLSNAAEDRTGNDPADKDTDNDGVKDGDEVAGTVASFTPGTDPGTGTLVINLAGGGTHTGQVTAATEIKCEGEGDNEAENDDDDLNESSHGADDPAGDDSNEDNGDNNDGEHGDGRHGRHGDDERACTTADLTPGTPVHEAELKGNGESAVFDEVELVK